jgi:tartrate dehydrogenase/decarboxylase/D-malate dehydrogenase
MTDYRIAVIPGDGVGPEVSVEAMAVATAAADAHGFGVDFEVFGWSCDRYLELGSMMPDDALDKLAPFDAILLGCIGDAARSPITSRWRRCFESGRASTSTSTCGRSASTEGLPPR